jgi:hypothetical protein
MKKLYFLNEDEKNRIINLHENATKKQYLLNEQTSLPDGTWTKTQKQTFDRLISNYSAYDYRNPLIDGIKNFCKKNVFGSPTLSDDEINSNAQQIENVMKSQEYSFLSQSLSGRGVTYKGINQFQKYLMELKNIVNFCYSINNITDLRGSETILDIFDEIEENENIDLSFQTSGFIPKILGSLKILSNQTKTQDSNKESGDTEKNKWDNFKCVKNDKRTKKTNAPNILKIEYSSGDYYFWDEGKYKSYKKGEKTNPTKEGNYKCDDNNQILILRSDVKKDSSKKTEDGTKEYGTGNWYSLNQTYDNQIKQALGKDPGKLTDEDINLIYDKLKQSGKIK